MRLIPVLALALASALLLPGCGGGEKAQPKGDPDSFTIQGGSPGTTAIRIEVLNRGDGAKAGAGKVATVHYALEHTDGRAIESSRGGQPFEFRIGAPMSAIEGWHIVVGRMRVGDRWKATIPPELAYPGGAGAEIPAGTTLVFDMELMQVRD